MKQVQKPRKPLIVYYLIAIAVLILFNSFVFPAIVGGNVEEVDYGTFLTMVENKEVSKVQLEGESIYFTDKSEDSRQYETTRFDDPDLVNRLEKAGCKFGRVADRQMSPFLSMLERAMQKYMCSLRRVLRLTMWQVKMKQKNF